MNCYRTVEPATVFSLMDLNSQEQVVLVARALKWPSGGSEKVGHPRFHQPLMLWGLQYYCKSQYYFLPSTECKG